MRNRPEFHVVDLAATLLRATPVSIYNSSSPEELQYVVDHAEAEIAVVEDVGFLERFLKVRTELPRLRTIFVIVPPADEVADDVSLYDALLSAGAADVEALGEATDPDDVATLIYTSGTTGPPKAVMISQHNVVYTCEQLSRCYGSRWVTTTAWGCGSSRICRWRISRSGSLLQRDASRVHDHVLSGSCADRRLRA